MRFLALETDLEKIKCRFICEGEEQEVLMTRYHGLSFLFAALREFIMTIILFAVGIGAWWLQAPMGYTVSILFSIWFFFVFFNLLKAWIDWRFDFLFVTTDKVVIVDQTSIIRQKVNPIHLENIGSVTSETQFGDMFNCGIVQINLKEGEGGYKVVLRYVPNAKEVASQVSDVVTRYQRKVVPQAAQNVQQQSA
jgi:hypothetical protein